MDFARTWLNVAMAEIVIDISDANVEDAEPVPVRPTLRRRLQALALAAVTVLSVSAGAPAGRPVLTHLFTVDDYGGEGLVTVEGDLILHSGRDGLEAYDIKGRLRWSQPDMRGFAQATTWRDKLIVTTHDLTAQTVVIDPHTGSVHWRVDGFTELVGDLLVVHLGPASGQNRGPVEIRRAGTYELVWSLPPRQAVHVAGQEGQILAIDASGVLAEHDLSTGRIVRSVQLPSPPRLWQVIFTVDERTLQLGSPGDGNENFLQVDRRTLEVLQGPLKPSDNSCGPVDCVHGSDAGVSIVDRSTGQQLWSTTDQLYPAREGMILIDPGNVTWLADFFTGARVRLDGWHPLTGYLNGTEPQLMRRDNFKLGKTDIGVLQNGSVRWLTTMPTLLYCRMEADLFLCLMPDQKIAIWRFALPT